MNVPLIRNAMLALLLVAVAPIARASGEEPTPLSEGETDPRPTLTVGDIQQAVVIGKLGLPLGTVVTIEGVVFDGQELRQREFAYETMLRVQEVNGESLEKEVLFVFPWERKEEAPAFGSEFRYRGYEHGRFGGLVDGAGPEIAGVAYHFDTSFVIIDDPE